MDRDLVARHLQMDYPEGKPFEDESGVGVTIGVSPERVIEVVVYDGVTAPHYFNQGSLDLCVLQGELSVYVAAKPSYLGQGDSITVEASKRYSLAGTPDGTTVMRTRHFGQSRLDTSEAPAET